MHTTLVTLSCYHRLKDDEPPLPMIHSTGAFLSPLDGEIMKNGLVHVIVINAMRVQIESFILTHSLVVFPFRWKVSRAFNSNFHTLPFL